MINTRLQIGHVFIQNNIGGCETCARSVIKTSSGVDHHVLFFSEKGGADELFAPWSHSITHHPIHRWNFIGFSKLANQWAKDKKLDGAILWHGLNALPPLMHGLAQAKIPTLIHGGNPHIRTDRWQEVKFNLLEKAFPIQQLPAYFCCSAYVAKSFQYSSYLKRFRTKVVYNGVTIEACDESKFPKTSNAITLGMTARLDQGKDHDTLLKAFALIAKEHPETKLEVLGDGPLRNTLEDLAKALGISHQVTFWGAQLKIAPIMQNWDVFVYSTTQYEGFGNSLAEAMWLGLPCLVTDVGPIPEVTGGSDQAIIAKAHDPESLAAGMRKLITHSELRSQLGAAAQSYAKEHYDPTPYAHKVLSLFQQID